MNFSAREIAEATGGQVVAGRPDEPLGPIATDTRTLRAGETFLALRGERYDGHDYVADAVRRGAAGVVVERAAWRACPPMPDSTAAVLVGDTRAALQDLGRAARGRLRCPVIAVTGSCGKTTVKEMIGQVLAGRMQGTTPPASFNNQVGVPLTLLAAGEDDRFVLCEFGTNHPGEIAALAAVARPTIGVVTLVAGVHLEGLGSIDGVAREKAALVDALPADGVAVLNADDPRVAAMAGRCRGRTVTVGLRAAADLRAEDFRQSPDGVQFRAGGAAFAVPVLGEHQAVLILAAAAACRELGVPLEDSAAALRRFRPPRMRLAVERAGDILILNDAYNASPASMRAALGLLALWPERRKVFFCGDMLELGPASRGEHEALGREIAAAGVAALICVGTESRATAAAAVAGGMKSAAVAAFGDAAAAAQAADSFVRDGDIVLVKGSRAMRMEQIVQTIARSCAK